MYNLKNENKHKYANGFSKHYVIVRERKFIHLVVTAILTPKTISRTLAKNGEISLFGIRDII